MPFEHLDRLMRVKRVLEGLMTGGRFLCIASHKLLDAIRGKSARAISSFFFGGQAIRIRPRYQRPASRGLGLAFSRGSHLRVRRSNGNPLGA
jgi:hypothetical protein